MSEETVEPLKGYGIYIKSHCEAPDFEIEIEAPNKETAVNEFKCMPPLWSFSERQLNEMVKELC